MDKGLHSPSCKWPAGPPCRKFSTDGSYLGAAIAHTMGTVDEQEIIDGIAPGIDPEDWREPFRSDIGPEQADWDEGEYAEDVAEEEDF